MPYRQYSYVGSSDILRKLPEHSLRAQINRTTDILHWVNATQQILEPDNMLTATFIIDTQHNLWINDRRSEHVLCANGENVLSAGEITFALANNKIEVVEITNQSTGYCPEPESWAVVAVALHRIGIAAPPDFTTKYIFRRCETCQSINLVKDEWFVCGVCESDLSLTWNFAINKT